MEPLRILLSRCSDLFRRRNLDEDLDAELSSHIEFAVEENMKRGMSAQEARTRALREFGALCRCPETITRPSRKWMSSTQNCSGE
jgi:hypothetical protein